MGYHNAQVRDVIAHEFLVMSRHIICVHMTRTYISILVHVFRDHDRDAFLGLQIAHLRLNNI